MAPTTRTSTRWPTRRHLPPHSSAASATSAKRTKRTTPTTSPPYSSKKLCKQGREETLSPFFWKAAGGIHMKSLVVFALLLAAAVSTSAQVSAHAPTGTAKPAPATVPSVSPFPITDRPVARVNSAILTDRHLLREMLQIFPYASQHNGFPEEQEASIRQGALQMIIFEELVYQEAKRRKLKIAKHQ